MKQMLALNTDLMRVAADEYGDATAWVGIAAANKLADYLVPGPAIIVVPDYDPLFIGGLPQQ